MGFVSRIFRFLSRLFWSIAVVSLLGSLALLIRLSAGPIDVPMRQDLLDRTIETIAPGWGLQAAGAEIDVFGRDGLSGLRLRDAVLTDPKGETLVRLPTMAVRLSWKAQRDFASTLEMRQAVFSDVALAVTRDQAGTFRLGFGDGLVLNGSSDSGSQDFDALLRVAGEALPDLEIVNARLDYRDERTGFVLATDDAQVNFRPEADGLRIDIAARVSQPGGAPVGLEISATQPVDGSAADIALEFTDLVPKDFAALAELPAPLRDLQSPISGGARFKAAKDGALSEMNAQIAMGEGTIILGDRQYRISSLDAALSGDPTSGDFDLERFALVSDTVRSSGRGRFSRIGQRWSGALELGPSQWRDPAQSIAAESKSAQVQIAAHPDTGVVLDALKATDLLLSDPEQGTLAIAEMQLSGEFSADGEQGRIGSLALRDIRAQTPSRASQLRIAALTGQADIESVSLRNASFRAAEATGIEMLSRDGKGTVAGARGSGRLKAGALELSEFVLSGLSGELPSGEGLAAERLGMQLRADEDAFDLGALTGDGLVVTLPELYAEPLKVERMAGNIDGRKTAQGWLLRPALTTSIEGLPGTTSAELLMAEGGARGSIQTRLGPTIFDRVPRYWPEGVSPGAYRWVTENVKGGDIPALTIAASFDQAQPDSNEMDLRFSFENATIGFHPKLPPIQNARGTSRASLGVFESKLERGRVDVPGSGSFSVSDSRFFITDFKPRYPIGNLELNADGPIRPILTFLDSGPLGFISKSGFVIDTASADAKIDVKLSLPLQRELKMADVRYDAKAQMDRFSFFEPHTGLPISGDRLQLDISEATGITAHSAARIDGLSARLTYRQSFDKPAAGEPESTLDVQTFVTAEDIAGRGIDLSEYFVGVASIDATAKLFPGGGMRFEADADLTSANLAIDDLGWQKPVGEEVRVRAAGFRNPDGPGRVESLEVRGSAAIADGDISFDAAGSVTQADFTRLILGERFDTALRYRRSDNGGSRIELEGELADLRTAFRDAVDSSAKPREVAPKQGGPVTEVAVRLGRAVLRDDLEVRGLTGGVRLRGSRTDAVKLNGIANGRAPFNLLAERKADGLAIRLSADDAGAFLNSASVFNGAYGGQLVFDARTRDTVRPVQISGLARIRNTEIRDSLTLQKILKSGSAASLVRGMTNNGLRIVKVDLPFSGYGGRWTINKGVAYGPALGLTLDGTYDLASEGMDLRGTLSPAYAINGALGQVPVLGDLLTGGEGEGVFALTFGVSGTTAQPSVWVNPLSAVAPGFLRKVVDAVSEGIGNAASGASIRAPQSGVLYDDYPE